MRPRYDAPSEFRQSSSQVTHCGKRMHSQARAPITAKTLIPGALPRGVLPDEMVAALQTLTEAQADGQHINHIDEDSVGGGSDSDDFDAFDAFVEEAEDPEAVASRVRADADCERAAANMNKYHVEEAVNDAQADLLNDGQVCCKCESAGHNGNLLLCDGPKPRKGFKKPRQGFKKNCAISCHTFCCEPPL